MDRNQFIAIRKALGLSQRTLAVVLGRSIAWVQGIEQGKYACPRYADLAMRRLDEHAHDELARLQ